MGKLSYFAVPRFFITISSGGSFHYINHLSGHSPVPFITISGLVYDGIFVDYELHTREHPSATTFVIYILFIHTDDRFDGHRYRIAQKLGYGACLMVWLARDRLFFGNMLLWRSKKAGIPIIYNELELLKHVSRFKLYSLSPTKWTQYLALRWLEHQLAYTFRSECSPTRHRRVFIL